MHYALPNSVAVNFDVKFNASFNTIPSEKCISIINIKALFFNFIIVHGSSFHQPCQVITLFLYQRM